MSLGMSETCVNSSPARSGEMTDAPRKVGAAMLIS